MQRHPSTGSQKQQTCSQQPRKSCCPIALGHGCAYRRALHVIVCWPGLHRRWDVASVNRGAHAKRFALCDAFAAVASTEARVAGAVLPRPGRRLHGLGVLSRCLPGGVLNAHVCDRGLRRRHHLCTEHCVTAPSTVWYSHGGMCLRESDRVKITVAGVLSRAGAGGRSRLERPCRPPRCSLAVVNANTGPMAALWRRNKRAFLLKQRLDR